MEEIFEQPAERYIQTAFADEIEAVFSLAPQNPALRFLIGLCVIILAIFAIKYLARMMQWATEKFLKNRGFIAQSWLSMIIKSRLIGNIFFAIGMVFLASLSHVVISEFYPKIGILIVRVLNALVLIAVMMVVNSALSVIAGKFANALHLPVKGLVQAVKMLFWIITAILIIATLIDKDPGLLLGGLTALSAIAMLVFKDSILGLVAGFQLLLNDLVRVGDWIEIPSQGIDGNIIDITLSTVRVQSWDNTIVNIPAYDMVSHAFTNWRGMSDSGGRRIKRAINIDINSIRFLTEEDIERLSRFNLIKDYLTGKEKEIRESNQKHGEKPDNYNARRLSNIGTFRRYCYEYLKHNPNISDRFTCMVRQLAPGVEGLPLEIYAFSANTAWVFYEDIQSDIFDHLLSVIDYFDLKVYQRVGDHFRQK